MARSWIRIAKLFQKLPSPRSKNRSASSKWPVDDTGRNSVTPSTIPRITARTASDIITWVHSDRYRPKKPGPSRLFACPPQREKYQIRVASTACVVSLARSRGSPAAGGGKAFLRPHSYQGLHNHAVSPPVLPAVALHPPGAG